MLALTEILAILLVPIGIVIVLLRQRQTAMPGQALVVYGRRDGARGFSVVRGSALPLPLIESAEPMSLEPFEISVANPERDLTVTASVRFPRDAGALSQCLERLGVRPREQIEELATDAILGAIARARTEDAIEHEVPECLDPLGLELESLLVTPGRAAPPRA
jgi:uncharacterized membrane protein YqiK